MKKSAGSHFKLFIYFVALVFFVYKMHYYAQYIGGFPDEIQHISYIAYLEKTSKIIPEFKDMKVLEYNGKIETNLSNENKTDEYQFGDAFNYLGHPPLYYQIMRLSNAVKVSGDNVFVNVFKLRMFNMFISTFGMLITLYIGYSRIGRNIIFNLLYIAIVLSVPMLAYDSAGINNDTLAFVGVSVFILGLLRFSEKKRNFPTYFILGLGIFLSFMAKLTAGSIITISLIIFMIFTIVKERSIRFLISKNFILTCPFYILTAIYYILVRLQTGSILPTYKLLDPNDFYKSAFYVQIANRTYMSFWQYSNYFLKNILSTWLSIESSVSLIKTSPIISFNCIGLFLIIFIPLILIFRVKKTGINSSKVVAAISVYLGLVVSVIIQWLRAYKEFKYVSGYLGGFQSRYYLCGVGAIGLSIVFLMRSLLDNKYKESSNIGIQLYREESSFQISARNKLVYLGCIILIGLLFYEDFIYFIINFKH